MVNESIFHKLITYNEIIRELGSKCEDIEKDIFKDFSEKEGYGRFLLDRGFIHNFETEFKDSRKVFKIDFIDNKCCIYGRVFDATCDIEREEWSSWFPVEEFMNFLL